MDRRTFIIGTGASVVATALFGFRGAFADVPKAYDSTLTPPTTGRDDYIKWMVANRGEDPKFLGPQWDRYEALLRNKDIWDEKDGRAFLLTPREDFVRPPNLARAFDSAFLDIGYGVTISGPHAVARMTSAIDVKPGEKVLEIGTGSGYQSAYLSHLTDKVWSIEIIKPLAERTRATYDDLIGKGYNEFKGITSKNADGYYGWAENAPFDKIVVTCGIDHIPPPLLQQLKPGGIMVIPVGPPGAQRVLKVEKTVAADGTVSVARSDIFNKIVPFVPFTKLEGDAIEGNHNK